MDRSGIILLISKRLMVFTVVTLVLTGVLFLFADRIGRFPISWFCIECGFIGGFVSIQQRLKNVSDQELEYLSQSWTAILVIPVFGGVFAVVLYLLFLSGIIESSLFPKFYIPKFDTSRTTLKDLICFFKETYPESGRDFAKLAFWSFVAGFSERFVPQIIHKLSDRKDN